MLSQSEIDQYRRAGYLMDFGDFNQRLVLGEPIIESRLVDVSVRLPLPPSPLQGSRSRRNQTGAKNRYFTLGELV
jgi:phytanoyl-CoA hydroxylase